MLPIWVFLFFVILLLTIVYLLWRIKNCKCKIYEKFETATEADAESADTNKEADVETKKEDTKVVEEEVDVEAAPESKKKDNGKDKETEDKKPKSSTNDKALNYSEMKLFDNLRENTYSLQDIKRMIREGEITEKMIEKFLARVENMENRSSSGKRPEVSIEGFSGNRYASATFH